MDNQASTPIVEFVLPGEKLTSETTDLNTINKVGQELYTSNKQFLHEKVKDNWYGIIEPISGTFVASEDINKLYEYTTNKFPNRLFYVIGLLKNFLN